MSVKMRQEVERKIIRRFIRDALAAGYNITVDNLEEEVIKRSTDARAILKAMFTVDDERLILHKGLGFIGWVYLIYGNGPDVISDYSTNLDKDNLMVGANKIAERYSD